MKKIRNLVIGGIENKVFNLILATVFLTAAAFMAGFLYQSGMLADLNEDTNERQLESISEITGNVMDQVVTQSMDQLTDKEAELSDELFGGLKNRVEMLGDYAGKLFSDPDNAPRVAYAQPEGCNCRQDRRCCQHVGHDDLAFWRVRRDQFLFCRAPRRRISRNR